LVIYDRTGKAIWETDSKTQWNLNHEGWFWLELRHDGYVKLYNAGDGVKLSLKD